MLNAQEHKRWIKIGLLHSWGFYTLFSLHIVHISRRFSDGMDWFFLFFPSFANWNENMRTVWLSMHGTRVSIDPHAVENRTQTLVNMIMAKSLRNFTIYFEFIMSTCLPLDGCKSARTRLPSRFFASVVNTRNRVEWQQQLYQLPMQLHMQPLSHSWASTHTYVQTSALLNRFLYLFLFRMDVFFLSLLNFDSSSLRCECRIQA